MSRRVRCWLSLIVTLVFFLGLFPSGTTAFAQSEIEFTDVDGHWAKVTITKWVQQGLIKGYTDGTFRPDDSITRAEFMALVNRAFGFSKKAAIGFSDVSANDWFYDEIAKAVKAGYISGYQDGTVKANREISRQEAAVALCKALNLELQNNVDQFTDKDSIPNWSRPYIGALTAKGYMGGYPDGSFRPEKEITRAETVTMLDNALKALAVTYDEPGIYGPEEGIETISKDVAINVPGVTLKNMVIEGNLYLNEGIGEGDVTLENVTVKGETIVRGGGENSIHLINFTCEEVIVIKVGGKVRIVASDSTKIHELKLQSGAHIEGEGIETITVLKAGEEIILDGDFEEVIIDAEVKMEVLEGTTIKDLKINSKSEVDLAGDTTVKNLTLDAAATVTGKGTIEYAEIKADDAKLEAEPKEYKVAEGVTAEIAGKEVKGGEEEKEPSKDKGSTRVPVTSISVEPTELLLPVGNTAKVTAIISPSNATNKKVTWSTSNEEVATVDENGNVTAVAVGTATITATTEDGGKRASCEVTVSESKVVNATKKKGYDAIQEAIDEAGPGDIIRVASGTYHEYLFIEKPISLLGPNAGIPGYSEDRGPEAIITVPEDIELDNPEGNGNAVIDIESSRVTIDGFRITGDNGNGKTNYAGCNIQAGFGIFAYVYGEREKLEFRNNVFDCFSNAGMFIVQYDEEKKDHGSIDKLSISGNLIQNIYDFRLTGSGYGIYLNETSGRINDNVIKDSRIGIRLQPYSTVTDGQVQDNDIETYLYGLVYSDAEKGAGAWTFQDNNITAIDPPDTLERPRPWRGINVNNISAEAGAISFINNTIDGFGTSIEHPYRSVVCGLHIRAGVEDDAKMIFEDNTITGVQIALKRETGNLDLDSVLAKNNFDAGSRVVENIIYIPLESSIYNITKDKYYDTIQEAVYAADEGDIIQVGPGIYHGYLTINKPLTLIGPNVGVPGAVLPGYYDERGPEAVITVPKEVDLENPEYAEMKAVINIESPGVTIDGFRITGDNGNGKKNYAGCNIQAAYGIYASDGEFELDNLVLRNNVFDCFSGMGICIIDFDDYTPNENISISRNLFRNIHDLRLEGPGQGILMLGATGSVTENVVGNSRLGIMVIPLDATGVGLVKDNYFETYVTGIIYKDAETGAGTWTFEENTVTAVDPPDNFEREARWRGITLQYISMGAGPVKFINNTVDGSGTSAEHNKRSKIIGLHIEEGVESDVEIIFKGNTVTGVQIGLIWDSGNLDLKDILVNNTFDHGSIIIDNTIRLPEENTVYNLETYEQYASIQEAVYEAKPGTTIVVGPGTYREDLVIPEGKDKLTLKGMNAGIPVGVWPTLWLGDRVPESIIVGSITVGSEGGQNGGTVEGLSIDGFTIDTRGEYGIALSATGETTIANNIIKGNGRAKHGIKVENVGTAHLIISCNTIEYYGTDEDSAGILIRGSNATAQITENLIDGAASYRDTYATGIEITEGAKANIVENWIQGNRFGLVLDSNDNIVSSNFIENNYWGIYMSKSGNSVTDNVIIENYIGVVADEGSDNTVTFNWIYDNDELGARTDLEGTHLTATHNWWGVSTADEVMEQISGNVEFSPWYIDEEMTVLSDEAAVEAVNSAFDEEELPTQLDRVFDEEALP